MKKLFIICVGLAVVGASVTACSPDKERAQTSPYESVEKQTVTEGSDSNGNSVIPDVDGTTDEDPTVVTEDTQTPSDPEENSEWYYIDDLSSEEIAELIVYYQGNADAITFGDFEAFKACVKKPIYSCEMYDSMMFLDWKGFSDIGKSRDCIDNMTLTTLSGDVLTNRQFIMKIWIYEEEKTEAIVEAVAEYYKSGNYKNCKEYDMHGSEDGGYWIDIDDSTFRTITFRLQTTTDGRYCAEITFISTVKG